MTRTVLPFSDPIQALPYFAQTLLACRFLRRVTLSLFVGNEKPRGWELARFDRDQFRQEDDQWILVAKVPLFTSKGEFCVNLTLGGRDDGFWPAINPVPTPSAFEWSNWHRTNKSRDESVDTSSLMFRFRFEKQMETPDQ
ncbi:hypothetical protein SH467x_001940 [Pirellulaceae bacterium SH467]